MCDKHSDFWLTLRTSIKCFVIGVTLLIALEQCCPEEHLAMMGIFCICAVQYTIHMHLKHDYRT